MKFPNTEMDNEVARMVTGRNGNPRSKLKHLILLKNVSIEKFDHSSANFCFQLDPSCIKLIKTIYDFYRSRYGAQAKIPRACVSYGTQEDQIQPGPRSNIFSNVWDFVFFSILHPGILVD